MITPLFTIVFLILMRLLMNPTISNVEYLLKLRRKEPDFELVKKAAETFKERVLTFFSSYISLTLIIFIFYAIIQYYTIVHNPSDLPGTVKFIISSDSIPDQDSILKLAFSYLGLLILFTVLIEIGLWVGTPIIQTRWMSKKKQKPLTVETFEKFRLSKWDSFLYDLNKIISLIREMSSNFVPVLKITFEAIKRRNKRPSKKRNFSYYYMEEMTEYE
jgi:hypothetical protein